MGGQLPQLCEQLARFLVVQCEDGQIARGTGGDPDGVLVEVSEALSAAGRAADMMAAALAKAGAKAAASTCRPASGPERLRALGGIPVRRTLTTEALVIIRPGQLTPADIGIFLALHRQVTRF